MDESAIAAARLQEAERAEPETTGRRTLSTSSHTNKGTYVSVKLLEEVTKAKCQLPSKPTRVGST